MGKTYRRGGKHQYEDDQRQRGKSRDGSRKRPKHYTIDDDDDGDYFDDYVSVKDEIVINRNSEDVS